MPINSHLILGNYQNLTAIINENEKGLILIEDLKERELNLKNNYFIAYDPDLGLNGTFDLDLIQPSETEDLNGILKELNSFLWVNPFNENEIKQRNTINLINKNPFDFENIDLNPLLDQLTGIGSKMVKFLVNCIKLSIALFYYVL